MKVVGNEWIGKMVRKIKEAFFADGKGVRVKGSVLVYIPPYRLNEIPKVIRENHEFDAKIYYVTPMVKRIP